MSMDICERIKRGERRALAKAITILESTLEADKQNAILLLEQFAKKKQTSLRIGVCGSPGVGKSSFIDELGHRFIESGHHVAVLAIDPTSPISGGSILGDKTRMDRLANAPQAYIRPSPGGGVSGGVTVNTHETIQALEFAGYDIVILETIGIGQSETEVATLVDKLLFLHQPESGDELQAIKKGIIEVSDLFIVTKADGILKAAAEFAAQQLRSVVNDSHDNTDRVFCISSPEKIGFSEVHDILLGTLQEQEKIQIRRLIQQRKLLLTRIVNDFRSQIANDLNLTSLLMTCEAQLSAKSIRQVSDDFLRSALKNSAQSVKN